jgi:hypothetical protein
MGVWNKNGGIIWAIFVLFWVAEECMLVFSALLNGFVNRTQRCVRLQPW